MHMVSLFPGYVSDLCDFVGHTCFIQILSNVTLSLHSCDECLDDCEDFDFVTMSTSSNILDNSVDLAK